MGYKQTVETIIQYHNEPRRLMGVCDHMLQYRDQDVATNFAAVLGGEESRGKVLAIIGMCLGCWIGLADDMGMLHHARRTAGERDCMVYGSRRTGTSFALRLSIIILGYVLCTLSQRRTN